jgi:hypothetical protein
MAAASLSLRRGHSKDGIFVATCLHLFKEDGIFVEEYNTVAISMIDYNIVDRFNLFKEDDIFIAS